MLTPSLTRVARRFRRGVMHAPHGQARSVSRRQARLRAELVQGSEVRLGSSRLAVTSSGIAACLGLDESLTVSRNAPTLPPHITNTWAMIGTSNARSASTETRRLVRAGMATKSEWTREPPDRTEVERRRPSRLRRRAPAIQGSASRATVRAVSAGHMSAATAETRVAPRKARPFVPGGRRVVSILRE